MKDEHGVSSGPVSGVRRGDAIADHLGSVVAITDDSGSLVSQQRYLPFGQPRDDVQGPQASPTDFGYTGQRANSYIKLLDYKSRWYSDVLGRFTSPDSDVPASQGPQALDRYAYTLNNPIRYTDPTGHRTCGPGNEEDGPKCLHDSWSRRFYENDKYQRRCAEGKDEACPGGTGGMVKFGVESILIVAGGGEFLLEGGAADLVDAGLTKAGVACLQSGVCRWITGMAGGAAAATCASYAECNDEVAQGFSKFGDLKQYLGNPGEDMEWHHIVEQSQITRSGFAAEEVQATDNIIAVDEHTHDLITRAYNSNVAGPGTGTVRDWLTGQSFQAQYNYGIGVLRDLGVIP